MSEFYPCKECNGKGKIHSDELNKKLKLYDSMFKNQPLGEYEEGWYDCSHCGGTGKIDWIEHMVGRRKDEPYSTLVNLVRTIYPRSIAKDLVKVQPMEKISNSSFYIKPENKKEKK